MKHCLNIVVALCGLLMVMGCQLLNPGPSSAACEGEVTCDIYLGSYVGDERSLKPGEVLFVRGECEQTEGFRDPRDQLCWAEDGKSQLQLRPVGS